MKCSIKERRVLVRFVKFTGKKLRRSTFFNNKNAGLRAVTSLKETPAQVFFCEICKIFKNTFFIENFRRPLLALGIRGSQKKYFRKV